MGCGHSSPALRERGVLDESAERIQTHARVTVKRKVCWRRGDTPQTERGLLSGGEREPERDSEGQRREDEDGERDRVGAPRGTEGKTRGGTPSVWGVQCILFVPVGHGVKTLLTRVGTREGYVV